MCMSLSTSTQPASKSWLFLLAPLGVPAPTGRAQMPSAGQRAEIPLNLPEFALHLPLVKMCTLLAGHIPRSFHWRVITLLCWRQADLSRFNWEPELNFYKTKKQHDFAWVCKSGCCSFQETKHSCALENKAISWWFQVLGESSGVLEMGSLLLVPTASIQKENGCFCQVLKECGHSLSCLESNIQISCTVSCIPLLPNSQTYLLSGKGVYHSKSGSEAKVWQIMPQTLCYEMSKLSWMKSSKEICSPYRNRCQRQLSGVW